jgi:hypothetical protein
VVESVYKLWESHLRAVMGVQVAATMGAAVVLVIGFDDDCRWGIWGGAACYRR